MFNKMGNLNLKYANGKVTAEMAAQVRKAIEEASTGNPGMKKVVEELVVWTFPSISGWYFVPKKALPAVRIRKAE